MINVSKIKKGIVLDHIEAGRAHVLYKALELDKVTDAVVLMQNIFSTSMGKNSEREIPGHKFFLYNRDKKEYKCEYCDTVTTYGE